MNATLQIIDSVDEIIGPGIEDMFRQAEQQGLVNGIALGVFKNDERFIRLIGQDISIDSVFEIGSLTKVFTSQLIDICAQRNILSWDDPVSKYFSKEVRQRDAAESKSLNATILEVALHTAGLPLLPENLMIRDSLRPFESYSIADLEAYLNHYRDAGAKPYERVYSNLGFMVLGYVLQNATGRRFSDLMETELLRPLGLSQTFLALSDGNRSAPAFGHTLSGSPAPSSKSGIFASAGGLCSTVTDQLLWIETLLGMPSQKLFSLYQDAKGLPIGIPWSIHSSGSLYGQSGTTVGFSSYLGINQQRKYGFILMMNRQNPLLIGAIRENFERAMQGLPLNPLQGDYGVVKAKRLWPIQTVKRNLYSVDFVWNQVKRAKIRAAEKNR